VKGIGHQGLTPGLRFPHRPRDPAAIAVEDRMYRWLAVLRFVLVANTVGLNIYRDDFAHPLAATVLVAALVAWTFLISWIYYTVAGRTTAWLVADMAVALVSIGLTAAVKQPGFDATVPGFWIMGAAFAWAIHWRLYGGVVGAVLLSITDWRTRGYLTETVYGNYFLLIFGGAIVGLMVDSLLRSAARTATAERAAAAAVERTKLARAVHDGVLQVLALIQRRAPELGAGGEDLGRLVAEQEQALRSLIRQQDAVDPTSPGMVDLGGALAALEGRPGVSVATPAHGVLLDRDRALAIVAVVSACLDNVVAHVGPDAPAWVLLEASSDAVQVSVRDEGPGIPEGRLAKAEREGRLGVTSSIRGRAAELGGETKLTTGSFGTEWELTVPRG
jgi:signal transduction histidine kinase